MKVKILRLDKGCSALKGGNHFMASKHTKIEHLGGSVFLVTLGETDPVGVSIGGGGFAVFERESSKVPVEKK